MVPDEHWLYADGHNIDVTYFILFGCKRNLQR
jgi:hypothetical protein